MPMAGGDAERDQGHGVVGQLLGLQVGQHEGDGDGVAGGLGDAQAEAAQDVPPVVLDDLGDRVLDDLAPGLDVLEPGRLGHLGPDDHADDDQQDADQERQPPGPGAGQVHADQEDQVGQQQADREAGLHDAGVLALLCPWGVFVGHQDRPAPLGAVGQALDDADDDQQDAGPDADALRRSAAGRCRTWPRPSGSGEKTSTGLRPTWSPRYPPITPPSGRTANPTPRVAKESRVPESGSAVGKKRCRSTGPRRCRSR